jgi:hypothetical protein
MKRFLPWLLLSVVCASAAIPPVSTYNWEAEAWRVRVGTNSGTITGKAYRTGTRFMQQTRKWDVRRYLGRANIYLGDQTNAMCIPIIVDWFSTMVAPDQLVAFVSTDYAEATGLTGNTTTKYLVPNSPSPGMGLSGLTSITNLHMAVYNRTASSQSGYCMGIAYSVGPTIVGFPISYANTTYLELGTVANQVSVADTTGRGFYVTTRRSDARAIYKNGASILISAAAAAGALAGGQVIVHAEMSSAGNPSLWTDRALSYHCFGFGIPNEKQAAYYQAVYNVQEVYNRQ